MNILEDDDVATTTTLEFMIERMEPLPMELKWEGSTIEGISNLLKTTANVTDMMVKKAEVSKEEEQKVDEKVFDNEYSNTNTQPQHQVVQVQVGDPNKKDAEPQKVVKKKETHIHKEFPDDRALTDAECELALQKAKMEHELKLKQMEFDNLRREQERLDRLEAEKRLREEDERLRKEQIEERKERLKRQEEDDKFTKKVFKFFGFGVGGITLAGIGLEAYKAWQNRKRPININYNTIEKAETPALPATTEANAE